MDVFPVILDHVELLVDDLDLCRGYVWRVPECLSEAVELNLRAVQVACLGMDGMVPVDAFVNCIFHFLFPLSSNEKAAPAALVLSS